MNLPLLSSRNMLRYFVLFFIFSIVNSSVVMGQVTYSSLINGDYLNGQFGNFVLNATAGTGTAYLRPINGGGLLQCVAIDGANNIAFGQYGAARLMRIDGTHVITFPVVTTLSSLAVDRDDEFIYAASTGSPNTINRYIWKNTGINTSVGFYVGAAINTATSAVARVPFLTSGDAVFLNGATTATPLTFGSITYSLAFDAAGNLFYADNTSYTVRKISIEKATPLATALGSSTITLSAAPSSAVKVNDIVSGLFIPQSTWVTAISGNTITLNHPITGAIISTSTIAIITGVSDIVGIPGTASSVTGATGSTTTLTKPAGLAFDPSGNLFINDQNGTARVLKVTASGNPGTINSASAVATFGSGFGATITGIATDAGGNLYLADHTNKILKISAAGGVASLVAGSGATVQLSSYTTTAGSPIITTTDLTDLNKIDKGMPIRGNGIPVGSIITDFNKTTAPYTITISNAAGTAVVSPDGNAAAGSTTITGLSSTTGIVAGCYVIGAGIPTNTTVVSVSGTTVTLSAATTTALTLAQLFFYLPGTTTSATAAPGSTNLTVNFADRIVVGQIVVGPGIPAATTVSSISGTTVTVSNATAAALSNTQIYFLPATTSIAIPTGTAASGATSLTVSSATGVAVGQAVVGVGIAPNTMVNAVSGTTITLSVPTTAALATTPLAFFIPNIYNIPITATASSSSSEDGFTSSSGSYGYIENPAGIVVSQDASSPFIVYPEQNQATIRKITGIGITTSTVVPSITSITPVVNPTIKPSAGATIDIKGTNFTGTTNVNFGGEDAVSFTVVSSTEITAVIGTGTTGSVYVTTPGGVAVSPAALGIFPLISSFTPASGIAGTSITITGDNFLGATAVKIGGTAVASYIINNNKTITAVTAAGVTGTIAITTASGTSSSAAPFTFVSTPSNLIYSTATATMDYGSAGTSVVPTVSGGAIIYSINADAPAGISINTGTGVISYGNTLVPGIYPLTVTATNSLGSTTASYTVTVNATAPTNFVYATASSTTNFGTAGASVVPSINTGGQTVTYGLTGTVSGGVSIDAGTGVISYSQTVAVGNYTLNVSAANTTGSTAITYNLIVSTIAPTGLAYSTSSLIANYGSPGTSVTPNVNNGGEAIVYTLSGTVPAGVNIDPVTGAINYTAALNAGTYPLTVVATNSAGNITAGYTIIINPIVPTALVYSPGTSITNLGVAGLSVAPGVNTGGTAIIYSLSGIIPSGIMIDPASGIINFDNTLAVGNYPLTVIATNSIGNTSSPYNIVVNAVAPTSLVYSPASSVLTRGNAGTFINPTIITGGATITYGLTGTVPSGVSINPSTGIISFANTVTSGTYTLTITATNSAGNTTASYNVTVNPSSNNNLTAMAISSGIFTPEFDSNTLSYSVGVTSTVNTITLTPTVTDAFATVKVNGITVSSGSASNAINLVNGSNMINVVVTAEDASAKTYTINVVKTSLSNNANISALAVSAGTLSPVFTSSVNAYTVNVVNATTSTTLTSTLADGTASQTLNGITLANGATSSPVALNVGDNRLVIEVKAQNNITIEDYTVTVKRAASSNADLASLGLSTGTLNPAFTPSITTYAVQVNNNVAAISLTPVIADGTASIQINNVAVISGNASVNQLLNVGLNAITIAVKAQDGTFKTYTINVTRAASSNANLASLVPSNGVLSPLFASGVNAYTMSVANNVASLTLTPSLSDATSTITVNGSSTANGSTSAAVILNVGANSIPVMVKAQDGTINTYIVVVTRAASSNADLTGLAISSGTLSPVFDAGTLAYSASVPNSSSTITLTPATADATAVVTINGATVNSGSAFALALHVGNNTINVTVKAQDGTIKVYTLTVNRALSSDANLSAINMSVGTLNPVFAVATTAYTVTVPSNTTSITVTPTVEDATAAIKVNGTASNSGNPSAAQALVVGSNTINITVTAQNGSSMVYNVNVIRLGITQNITFATINPVTYGAVDFSIAATSDNSTLPLTYSSTNTAVATIAPNGSVHVVGAGSTVITVSQNGNATYQEAMPVNQTLQVNPATLTITANNQSKVYGTANPILTLTYAGFVNNDDGSKLTAQPNVNTIANVLSSVNNYPITVNGASSPNYNMLYVNGILNVTPANLTVTLNNQSKAYGAALPGLTFGYSGFVNGDDATKLTAQPVANTTATASSPVNTYPISASGAVAVNYAITYVPATLTITPVPLNITANNLTALYGAAIPTLTVTYTGLVNGDNAASLTTAPLISTTASPLSPVATYPISVSGAVNKNYTISYVAGTLTISIASRTLVFNTLPAKTYGDPDFSLTSTISSGEVVNYTSSNPLVATIINGVVHIITAGTITITASVPVNSNYSAAPSATQQLVINRAAQTIDFAHISTQLKGSTLTLIATSSTGLPVTFTSSDTKIATINGQTADLIGFGTTAFTALQAGDINYLPIAVSQLVNVQENLVTVHRGVSPNADGINDYLMIDGINDYPDNKLTIVNRNGIKMYQTSGYNNNSNNFNGHSNINGSLMQAGTYFYELEIKTNGETKKMAGYFILKYN
jgi:gliding motility-associated-like protein